MSKIVKIFISKSMFSDMYTGNFEVKTKFGTLEIPLSNENIENLLASIRFELGEIASYASIGVSNDLNGVKLIQASNS